MLNKYRQHQNLVKLTLVTLHREYEGIRLWEISTGNAYALYSVKLCLQEYKKTKSITAAMKKLIRIVYGKKGHPDITGIYHGIWVGIEAKTASAKQSPDQKTFEAMINKANGCYFVINDHSEILEQTDKLDRIKQWATSET